jgi:hypothetical protein
MLTRFPYKHCVDCINKIVYIYWEGNGQLGRYGVPAMIKKFYPGYKGKLVTEEYLNKLKNQQVQS